MRVLPSSAMCFRKYSRNPYWLCFTGTSGRECNATSLLIDGCQLMCCGKGYRTEIYTAKKRCHCTFEWCCEVHCEVCTEQRTRHICNWYTWESSQSIIHPTYSTHTHSPLCNPQPVNNCYSLTGQIQLASSTRNKVVAIGAPIINQSLI